MTTPAPTTPSKAKTWIALAGSVLTFVVPLVVSAESYLPSPWPAVIGGAIAVLTALGVYKAPYTPADTVIVPTSVAQSLPPAPGEYRNPYKQ